MDDRNLSRALNLLKFIEAGAIDAIRDCYAPDAVQIEWPNRIATAGAHRTVETLAEDFRKGQRTLASQSFEVMDSIVNDNAVVLEVIWRGALAIDLGHLCAGDQMVAHCAICLRFRDGKIVSQRNYDCFDQF